MREIPTDEEMGRAELRLLVIITSYTLARCYDTEPSWLKPSHIHDICMLEARVQISIIILFIQIISGIHTQNSSPSFP
ncbi:hypothetical protein BT63DRAFT_262962 [Microthyrium microscopicum]|uniref:Uncharacterized protein n=1 Tax=Microthyrium microscopicum TaxID=703497 RepID=A0A6A6UDH8_9PEZI|nr:hypothetical protein BT63DRAFT_262962 [Microthyrium microscopicum]